MDKAVFRGLAFRRSLKLELQKPPSPISNSYFEFAGGAYRFISRRYYRPIEADLIESSATEMRENINGTIDASILDRWRGDTGYRLP